METETYFNNFIVIKIQWRLIILKKVNYDFLNFFYFSKYKKLDHYI